jgi:outer membrane protein assembly factor BamB
VLSAALALVTALSCGKKNHAADIPAVPAGRDSCFVDSVYSYTTIATDPDGDSVAVRVDWGDATTSEWSGLAPSGDTLAFSHSWPAAGTYQVRAEARDVKLLTSDWSVALTVNVYVARPAPNAPNEPDGPAKGGENTQYTFSTVAFHPETMNVSIRFAWGDGDTSDWSDFVAPGESISKIHAWSVPDTYAVTAQAKDTGNAMSEWSTPHYIRIVPPDTLMIWRKKLTTLEGGSFYSSPAFGTDGDIYVGSPDSALYKINPADGSVIWRYPTNGIIRSSPAIGADGTIYFGSYDDFLYAIGSDGTLVWGYPTGDNVHASPAIGVDATVYVASLDHWLYAVSPAGALDWHTLANRAARSSPAVAANGIIFVGTDDGSICAVNPNGQVGWERKTGGTIHATPSFGADGTIYCGSDDGIMYALNPDSSLKWRYQTGGPIEGSAVIGPDGTIYFGSDDSVLYALDPNGTLKWRYQTGGSIAGSPAIAADGTIYFGSADYSVYALNSQGAARWQYEADGGIKSSPTIGPDGKIYFTSGDGYLYALKGTSPLAGSAWPKFHHDIRNTGRASTGR